MAAVVRSSSMEMRTRENESGNSWCKIARRLSYPWNNVMIRDKRGNRAAQINGRSQPLLLVKLVRIKSTAEFWKTSASKTGNGIAYIIGIVHFQDSTNSQ
ncbi:hypothetical protein E2C01_023932 [Portunus trituberculatus]|uniref:Uncharacterized protein n=1 Tax=Portunus trituberculatus TaxID=210409 RepID=A0A5B7ED14_PORTR|nr:hypothetical protein [Portunus trituberculatus]